MFLLVGGVCSLLCQLCLLHSSSIQPKKKIDVSIDFHDSRLVFFKIMNYWHVQVMGCGSCYLLARKES